MPVKSTLFLRRTVVAAAVATLLAICGGGDDGPSTVGATGTCIDGNTANADPFAVNVSDVHKADKGCAGKGVRIGIVDTAMELNHEDLQANVLPGQSFNVATLSNDTAPAPNEAELDHGTRSIARPAFTASLSVHSLQG